jgi:hypothetical protein
MVTPERKSSRSHIRTYLNAQDTLVSQYSKGLISEGECRSLYALTLERLTSGLNDAFDNRVRSSGFFRDPAPEPDGAASPVSSSDG